MNEIELSTPIKVDGKTVKKLPIDMDGITVSQFVAAEAKAKASASDSHAAVAEIDYGFQLYLGFYGAIAANPALDITDLERVKGRDLNEFMRAGRFFTTSSEAGAEEEGSGENSSDN